MSPDEMRILREAERKLIQAELRYLGAAKNSAKAGKAKQGLEFARSKAEYLAQVKKFGMSQEEAASSLSEVSNIC